MSLYLSVVPLQAPHHHHHDPPPSFFFVFVHRFVEPKASYSPTPFLSAVARVSRPIWPSVFDLPLLHPAALPPCYTWAKKQQAEVLRRRRTVEEEEEEEEAEASEDGGEAGEMAWVGNEIPRGKKGRKREGGGGRGGRGRREDEASF